MTLSIELLCADQQEAITKSAAAAEDRAWTIAAEKTAWYLEQLKSRGMKVLPPSAELKAGFTKFGEQIIAEWRKKAGADGEAVLAAFKKQVDRGQTRSTPTRQRTTYCAPGSRAQRGYPGS